MSADVHCEYYASRRCLSCGWIERSYAEQLQAKAEQCKEALQGLGAPLWEPPQRSAIQGFRNKAKLVVAGEVDAPTLGIVDAQFQGIDLVDCLLYPEALRCAFEPLRRFIVQARLTPYDISARRGELKYLLLTVAEDSGELMLRFVLRSREALARIEKHLPDLRGELPQLRAISVNLQPQPAAVLEGPIEIPLSSAQELPLRLNGLELRLPPQSFFQTNTAIAAALYATARNWTAELSVSRILDLYCGIGGFALHLAQPGREVVGLELSAQAIAAAQRAADAQALRIRFQQGDATQIDSLLESMELVVVNPPRRGLGAALCNQLNEAAAEWLLYSSCNPDTLRRDLQALPAYAAKRAQVFDMFPHTPHCEVLVLLKRNSEREGKR